MGLGLVSKLTNISSIVIAGAIMALPFVNEGCIKLMSKNNRYVAYYDYINNRVPHLETFSVPIDFGDEIFNECYRGYAENNKAELEKINNEKKVLEQREDIRTYNFMCGDLREILGVGYFAGMLIGSFGFRKLTQTENSENLKVKVDNNSHEKRVFQEAYKRAI